MPVIRILHPQTSDVNTIVMKNMKISTQTVLLGLDPGKKSAIPLDPREASGARLMHLSGLDEDGYGETFCCMNVHPGQSPESQDAPGGKKILKVLRGRRVVALGRRVSRAVGAPEEWFRWEVSGGITVASMPHPSGLNRWWNDLRNVSVGKKFVRSLLKPCIHVEGPDGSGKSTVVPEIGRMLGLRVVQTEDPPKSWSECVRRIDRRIRPGIVCDRSSGLISELVYGPVLRGGTIFDEGYIWSIVQSVSRAVLFIYCRPPIGDMVVRTRPGESPSHTREVERKYRDIVDRYDRVMSLATESGATVLTYDRTRSTIEEVLKCAGL